MYELTDIHDFIMASTNERELYNALSAFGANLPSYNAFYGMLYDMRQAGRGAEKSFQGEGCTLFLNYAS
jgi:hypothetical protein